MENFIGKKVKIIVDRPLGSKHPKYQFVYPINYGFVPNTIAGDNEEIDAYILGENKPLKNFTGVVIAVVHRLNDNEDKLVVTHKNLTFTDEEILKQTHFQEQYFKSVILR